MPKTSPLSAAQAAIITSIGKLLSEAKKTESALAQANRIQSAKLNTPDSNLSLQVIAGRVVSNDQEFNAGLAQVQKLTKAHDDAVENLRSALSPIMEDSESFFVPLLANADEGTSERRLIESAQAAILSLDLHPMNRARRVIAALSPLIQS